MWQHVQRASVAIAQFNMVCRRNVGATKLSRGAWWLRALQRAIFTKSKLFCVNCGREPYNTNTLYRPHHNWEDLMAATTVSKNTETDKISKMEAVRSALAAKGPDP